MYIHFILHIYSLQRTWLSISRMLWGVECRSDTLVHFGLVCELCRTSKKNDLHNDLHNGHCLFPTNENIRDGSVVAHASIQDTGGVLFNPLVHHVLHKEHENVGNGFLVRDLATLEAVDGCNQGDRLSVLNGSDLAESKGAFAKEINEFVSEPFADLILQRVNCRFGTGGRLLGTLLAEIHTNVASPLGVAGRFDLFALHRRGDSKERKKSEEKSVHVGKSWVKSFQQVLFEFL
jgi:hypothetical protein